MKHTNGANNVQSCKSIKVLRFGYVYRLLGRPHHVIPYGEYVPQFYGGPNTNNINYRFNHIGREKKKKKHSTHNASYCSKHKE